MEDKKIEMTMEEYKNLVSENIKYKAEIEVLKSKPHPVRADDLALEIVQDQVSPGSKKEKRRFYI